MKVLAAEETGQGHYWCPSGDSGACAEMFSRSRAHGECPRGSEVACILRHRRGTTDSDHGCGVDSPHRRFGGQHGESLETQAQLWPTSPRRRPRPCFSAGSVHPHAVSSGTTVTWDHSNAGAAVAQSSGARQGSMSHVRAAWERWAPPHVTSLH